MSKYVDLATVKLALREQTGTYDALITRAIDGAERAIEHRTGGRVFTLADPADARTYRARGRVARDRDGEVLLIDDVGAVTGLVVEIGGGTTWTTVDDYTAEPDNALATGRPITRLRRTHWPTMRVRVTAQWGWPEIPPDIAEAAKIQSIRLYKRKDNPEGVAGNAEWGLIRMPHLDPDVREMVDPYHRDTF